MSTNIFVNLPATAGNGSGAGVDTSRMGWIRTITVDDAFLGTVVIEVSLDGGTTWAALCTFTNTGTQTVQVAAQQMRATRSGVPTINPGLPVIEVGSDDNGSSDVYTSLNVPAGNGTGTATDVSSMGPAHSVTVIGPYGGNVNIEISEDDTTWATQFTFSGRQGIQNAFFFAKFARVTRSGVPQISPGAPVISMGAVDFDDSSGGGAAGTYSPPEKWAMLSVPANLSATPMDSEVSQLFPNIEAIKIGSIVGISLRFSANLTAGTATATVTVNGVAGTLSVTVGAGNSQAQATQLALIDTYSPGDLIGIQLATAAGFLPSTSIDCEAWLLMKDR